MVKIKIFGKEVDYKPYMDEMYIPQMKIRLISDKTFIRVFKNNITDNFINTLKKVVDPEHLHEQNMMLSVSGKTGSGKSIVVISLCKLITPTRFSYKNVCFFDTQIINIASTLIRDSFIIRDEGVDKAVFGIGSQRTSRQLQVLGETCRKSGLNLIFIEPEFRENELAKYYLETVDMDIVNRITRVAVKDSYTKQYIGSIYIPVVDDDNDDWIKYNEIKDKFIEDVKTGKLNEGKLDYKDIAKEVVSKIDLDVYEKKKERLAFIRTEFPNFTNSEIDIISTFVEVIIKSGKEAIED